MRNPIALTLALFVSSNLCFMRAEDTCSRCGIICGRTASNCMIAQDGSTGWCSWENGAEVKWANGKVEETVYVCE